MKFPPRYTRTPAIEKLVYKLDVLKSAWGMQSVSPSILENLQRQTHLRSALYSARIEGNPIREEELDLDAKQDTSLHTVEIQNVYDAYTSLRKNPSKSITLDYIRELHKLVLKHISASAGHLRHEQSAIFNQAGVAVYVTPPPQKLQHLLSEMIDWYNKSKDHIAIKASVVHIWFEKIHPFLDGNGRVGRLITAKLLTNDGYDFGGIVPFEKYLDENRQEYYDALLVDTQDVSAFVEFFLTALISQAGDSIDSIKYPQDIRFPELLPRRAEIVQMIADHRMITFDFLARRFRAVSARTLHYDLEFLVKKKYIGKRGMTRGVVYIPAIAEIV
jgi:Fic family protein